MVVGTISGIVSLAALVCAIWFIISGRKKKQLEEKSNMNRNKKVQYL